MYFLRNFRNFYHYNSDILIVNRYYNNKSILIANSLTSYYHAISMIHRPTIGFLTANIHTGASQTLWPGVLDAAAEQDVNLLTFPGGSLGAQPGFEGQRNAIYDLASPDTVEALVSWASTLGSGESLDEIHQFHNRFQPLSVVSMARPLPGIPTITMDSYAGMRAAILHLIEVHGLRRIAFIRGPESHPGAQERYRAYVEVLQSAKISFDARLVTPPMDWGAGVQAAQLLLDERGLRPGVDFEAIAAVSDLLALAAMKTLQARGIRVPEDVAMVGFNDYIEGRHSSPPLSSVYLSFHEQGYQALSTALRLMAGESVPQIISLPTRLVVRQSCGCPSQSIQQAAARHKAPPQETKPLSELLASLKREAADRADREQLTRLLDAFAASLARDSSQPFLAELELILQQEALQGGELSGWHAPLSWMRSAMLPCAAAEMRARCEDLFSQARVLVGEVALRHQANQQLNLNRQSAMLRQISQQLITTFDIPGLAEVLAENLPGLGIPACYLVLYDQDQAERATARMVMAYCDGARFPLDDDGVRFATRSLIPAEFLPGRRWSMVVEPLFFREQQIGYIVFEVGPRDGSLYEVLRAQIGSAIKGALLFQQAQQARLSAEKADRIKTRLLANVSHELRTPLNIILNRTKDALASPSPYGNELPPELLQDLRHIQNSAEHQLRVINDLLDLSRAEINELDLYLELTDPRALLDDIFRSFSLQSPNQAIQWTLNLPDKLPLIKADPVRLRQILLNLLSNAARFTQQGAITLGAEVSLPHLHLWVQDTGIGISPEDRERIFEPFVTAEHDGGIRGGIGLGLSITRWLVTLHGGKMSLESEVGRGSVFHVYLPLPRLGEQISAAQQDSQPALVLVSGSTRIPPGITDLCQRQGLTLYQVRPADDLELVFNRIRPACLVWDMLTTSAAEWQSARRFTHHPRLAGVPLMVYAGDQVSLTEILVKPTDSQPLLDAIAAIYPSQPEGLVLIVDDDPETLTRLQRVVADNLKNHTVKTASGGKIALEIMAGEVPSLVILDVMMPEMDGFTVLEQMRGDARLACVPVIVLSNKQLNSEDIRRLEKFTRVVLHTKGILTEPELVAVFHRSLFEGKDLPDSASLLVNQALVYIHQNYSRSLTRWEIAASVGVSEDYLSRVFLQELNLPLWDYINRYRIYHAQRLLRLSAASIQSIARQVGFKDQAYFSRVFHSLTGVSPSTYRVNPQAIPPRG